MIGEFTDRGPKLFSEKVAGNVCGCIGFVKDKNTKFKMEYLEKAQKAMDATDGEIAGNV